MAQVMVQSYTLLELQMKYPHLGLTTVDILNIHNLCTKLNTHPNMILSSGYTSLWISATRIRSQFEASTYLDPKQKVARKRNRQMCRALEKLCVRNYTVDSDTLQHNLQQSCGPDPTPCNELECINNGTIPCSQQCWQVFYCSLACKQKDYSRHSETCILLPANPENDGS